MSKTKNKLVLFLSFLTILAMISSCKKDDDSAEPTNATVNGTLILPQEANGKEYWVLIDNDLDGGNGYVSVTSGTCGSGTTVNYSISNVTSGTYYISAGVRIFSAPDNPPEEGDYVGIYGGTIINLPGAANAVVPSSGTVTFDITLDIMGAGGEIWITRSPMLTIRTSLGPSVKTAMLQWKFIK